MSIQLGIYDEEADLYEEAEDFLSTPSFFYFAEILSKIMDSVREPPEDETKDYHAAFFDFINEEREQNEEFFAAYCDFVSKAHATMEEEHGAMTDVMSGEAPIMPQPEEFDPDARAFLGRLVVSDEAIAPQVAGRLFYALIWLGIILKRYALHFEQEDPEVLRHIEFAAQRVNTIAGYCERALEESKSFKFSC